MNRRGFFWLLAAVALLPKRAVGQLKYNYYTFVGKAYRAGFMIPRPAVKVGEIKSSPGLLWKITDEGLDE